MMFPLKAPLHPWGWRGWVRRGIPGRTSSSRDTHLVSGFPCKLCERTVAATTARRGVETVIPTRAFEAGGEHGPLRVFLNPNSCLGFEPERARKGDEECHKLKGLSASMCRSGGSTAMSWRVPTSGG